MGAAMTEQQVREDVNWIISDITILRDKRLIQGISIASESYKESLRRVQRLSRLALKGVRRGKP